MYCTENYATMNLKQQQHSILAQLRCGILPLQIEVGRFTNVQRMNRKCTLCECDTVEDETHFILVCPFYNSDRTRFHKLVPFPPYSQAGILKYLFENYPRQLAKYVTRIWLKRKEELYI